MLTITTSTRWRAF